MQILHNITNITQYAIKFTVCTCKFVQLWMISQCSRQIELRVAFDSSFPGHINCLSCSLVPVFEAQYLMQSPGPQWRLSFRRMQQPVHNLGRQGRACQCQRASVTNTSIPCHSGWPVAASAFNLKLNAAAAQPGSGLTRRCRHSWKPRPMGPARTGVRA